MEHDNDGDINRITWISLQEEIEWTGDQRKNQDNLDDSTTKII